VVANDKQAKEADPQVIAIKKIVNPFE